MSTPLLNLRNTLRTSGVKTRVCIFMALLVGLLTLLFIPNIPQGTHLWRELLDVGHAILFGLLTTILLWTARGSRRFRTLSARIQYVWVGTTLFILGLATEIIQPYFQRDGEIIDVVRDSIGILIAFCIIAVYRIRQQGRGPAFPHLRLWTLYFVTTLLLIGVFETTAVWALAYLHRDRAFPILVSFESPQARKFAQRHQVRLAYDIAAEGPDHFLDSTWAKITFLKAIYPGLTIDELYPDWRNYDSLTFSLYSSLPTQVRLGFRAEDRLHNFRYDDRFNAELVVNPGVNHYSYLLARLQKAPKTRSMQLENMGSIWLYALNPSDTFSLYLSPILLKH